MKNIFKVFIVFLLVFLLSLNTIINIESFSRDYVKHNNDTSVLVEEITINSEKDSIYTNETLQMSVLVGPENASDKTVTWAVKNGTGEATIDENGLLTPTKIGTVTVRAIANDGSAIFTSKNIEILPVLVSSLEISGDDSIERTKTTQFSVSAAPDDAYNKAVTWSVENGTGSAEITSNGYLTATSIGTVIVKATAADGSGVVATKEVTVTPLLITWFQLKGNTILNEGKKYSYVMEFTPKDADIPSMSYTIWNETGEATVDENGYVTAIKEGTVKLLADTTDGSNKSYMMDLHIYKDKPDALAFRTPVMYLEKNSSQQMLLDIYPKTLNDVEVTYSCESYLSCTQDGVVTALKDWGSSRITVCTRDNIICESLDIRMVYPGDYASGYVAISNITATQNEIILEPGDTEQLDYTISPSSVTTKESKLFFVTDDSSIASVDQNGRIFAYKTGYTTLRVISAYLDRELVLPISVVEDKTQPLEVKKIIIDGPETITTNKSFSYSAIIEPVNAVNKDIKWTITNFEGDATIDQNGTVTATTYGQSMIKAAAQDGSGVYATKIIDITQNFVTNLTIDGPDDLNIRDTGNYTITITPEDADDKRIVWSVENGTGEATIDQDGKLTPVSLGTVTVKVSAQDGSGVIGTKTVNIFKKYLSSIVISGSNKININKKYQYTVGVAPTNANDTSVTWSVENGTGEATIDQTGYLTPVSLGTVTIKATANDGSGVYATFDAEVTDLYFVENVVVPYSTWFLDCNKSLYMNAVIYPSNASNKNVTWSSSDTSIATIDANTGAMVTTNKHGYVTITATAKDGSGAKGSIRFLVGDPAITIGGYATLQNSSYTQYDTVTWSSSNPSVVATTNRTGHSSYNNYYTHYMDFIGVSNGTATVYMKTISGTTLASSTVHVYTPLTDITPNVSNVTLGYNETKQINVTYSPSNASDNYKNVYYTSEDESVATVDPQTGLITGVGTGTTRIIIKSLVQNRFAYVIVNVVIKSEDITLNTTNINLDNDNTSFQIEANVLPENASNNGVNYIVGDNSVVSVSEDGLVHALKNGETTITVRSKDGNVEKTINVKVENYIPCTGIRIDEEDTLNISSSDEAYQIRYSLLPEGCSQERIIWSVGDETVVNVSEDGKVTGLRPGITTLTMSTTNGFTDSITINVDNFVPATGLSVNTESFEISSNGKYNSYQLTGEVTPEEATNKRILWSSANEDIAFVMPNGLVIGMNPGTTTITARVEDSNITKTINVTVRNFACTGVEINEEDILYISSSNEPYQAKYNLLPDGCTIETVTWSTGDETVASVDENGYITGHKPGLTPLIIETSSGKRDAIQINVDDYIPVTSMSINSEALNMEVGGSFQLETTITPEDATDKTVTYTVEDDSILFVSSTGLVRALGVGNTNIIVRTSNSNVTKTINVNVILGYDTVYYYVPVRNGNIPDASFVRYVRTGEEITLPEEYQPEAGFEFEGIYSEYYSYGYDENYSGYWYNGSFYNKIENQIYSNGNGTVHNIYIQEKPISVESMTVLDTRVEDNKLVVDFEISPKNAAHKYMYGWECPPEGGDCINKTLESNYDQIGLDSYYVKFDITKEGEQSFNAYGDSGYNIYLWKYVANINGEYGVYDQSSQIGSISNTFVDRNTEKINYTIYTEDWEQENPENIMYIYNWRTYNNETGEYGDIIGRGIKDNLTDFYFTVNNLEPNNNYYVSVTFINKEKQTFYSTGFSFNHTIPVPEYNVTSNSYNSLKIELTNFADLFERFDVYRSPSIDYNQDTNKWEGNYVKVGEFNASDGVYIDRGLKEFTRYYYKLTGYTSDGIVVETPDYYYYNHNATGSIREADVKVTATGPYSFKATWNKVDGANEYEVYLSTSQNSWSGNKYYKHLTYKNTLAVSYSKLSPNKTYYVIVESERVIRKKNSVHWAGSSHVVVPFRTAPAVPTFYVGKKNYNTIKVDVRATGGAVRYDIYRSTSAKGSYTKIAELNEPSVYLDTNLITTKTYYYKIRACNSEGRCSSYTGEKHAKVTLNTPSITLKASADKNALITYKPIEGANGYEIYWSTNKKKWSKLGETDSTTFEKAVPLKKKYFYRVRAYTLINGKKYYSSFSGIKYITINIGKPTVKIVKADVNKINITYNKVAGTTKYQVYRSTNKKKWTYIGSTENLEFLTTIELNKNYYYKVRSFKTVSGKNYYGAFSDIKTGKIGVLAPKISVNTEDNSINITEARDRTGYYVYRSTDKKKWTRIGITEELNYVDTNYVTRQYYYKARTYIDVDGKRYFSGYSNIIGIKQVYVPPVDPVEPEP